MARARAYTVAIVVALFLAGGAVEAQIYKWVDEKGTVHFGQSPPPEGSGVVETLPEGPGAPVVQGGPQPYKEDYEREDVFDRMDDRRRLRDSAGDGGGREEEPIEPGSIIVDEDGRDPAVWWRGRAPANAPGQPIRQPGVGVAPPRAVPRGGGRR
jgi:hypothetical protein